MEKLSLTNEARKRFYRRHLGMGLLYIALAWGGLIGCGQAMGGTVSTLPTADTSALRHAPQMSLPSPVPESSLLSATAQPELTPTTEPEPTMEPISIATIPETDDFHELEAYYLQKWGDACISITGKHLTIEEDTVNLGPLEATGATGSDEYDPLNVHMLILPRSDFNAFMVKGNQDISITDAQIRQYYVHNFAHELFHYCRSGMPKDVSASYLPFYRELYDYYVQNNVAADAPISPDSLISATYDKAVTAIQSSDPRVKKGKVDQDGETLVDTIISLELGDIEGNPNSLPHQRTGYGSPYRQLLINAGITMNIVIPYMNNDDYAGLRTLYITRVRSYLKSKGENPAKAEPLIMGMMAISNVLPEVYYRHYLDYYDKIMSK